MTESVHRARKVAAAIETDIEAGGWQVGTILGSEPELCRRYNVSRAVMREAVRLLESKKIARMKPGRGGGLLICEPDVDLVVSSAALLLRRMDVQLGNLVEAHRGIAVTSARLAADRIDERGVRRLRALQEKHLSDSSAPEPPEIRAYAMKFHVEIALLTHNPVVVVFTEVLVTLTNQRVPLPSADTWPAVRHAHRRIIEAIIAHDHALAQHRMHRHFDAIAASWRTEVAPAR